ncbi:MAG: hypothetical protein WBL31_10895 [Ilumatobacteraceae bacterium]
MAEGSMQQKAKVWSFVVDLGPDPAFSGSGLVWSGHHQSVIAW